MPKKTPLVKDARAGLDALKARIAHEMSETTTYRDTFRRIAKQHLKTNETEPKSPQDP